MASSLLPLTPHKAYQEEGTVARNEYSPTNGPVGSTRMVFGMESLQPLERTPRARVKSNLFRRGVMTIGTSLMLIYSRLVLDLSKRIPLFVDDFDDAFVVVPVHINSSTEMNATKLVPNKSIRNQAIVIRVPEDTYKHHHHHPRLMVYRSSDNNASAAAITESSFQITSPGFRHDVTLVHNEKEVMSSSSWDKDSSLPLKPLHMDQSMCVPMSEWQTKSRPTCNLIHEIDLYRSDARRIGSGGWRMAWRVSTSTRKMKATTKDKNEKNVGRFKNGWNGTQHFALKTIKGIKHGHFDASTLHRHFVDAAVTERLTGSPYVVDIWGYCAQSVINEFAQDSLSKIIKRYKKKGSASVASTFSSAHKLTFVTDVARGIADLHGIDGAGGKNASAVYKDLKPANIVVVGGDKDGRVLKISDFNDAELLLWNRTSNNSQCGFRRPAWTPTYHSPEEVWEKPLTEKVDVYALGGIIYYILTGGKHPYDGMDTVSMFKTIARGIPPKLPQKYANSTDSNISHLVKMMKMCHKYSPRARPSASKLVQDLMIRQQ